MPREVHPTPRHLGAQIRYFGFTAQQILVIVGAALVVYACARFLPAWVPPTIRPTLGLGLAGLPLYFAFRSEVTRSLLEIPERILHLIRTPPARLPGPPRRGARAVVPAHPRPPKEDPDD